MAGERKRGGCKGASERKENKGATRKMLVMPKILDTGNHGQEKKKIRCACRMHTLAASQW
jgi:hypothetical protein